MSEQSQQPILAVHDWVRGEKLGFKPPSILADKLVCKRCGILRRPVGGNGPCKGVIKVSLR